MEDTASPRCWIFYSARRESGSCLHLAWQKTYCWWARPSVAREIRRSPISHVHRSRALFASASRRHIAPTDYSTFIKSNLFIQVHYSHSPWALLSDRHSETHKNAAQFIHNWEFQISRLYCAFKKLVYLFFFLDFSDLIYLFPWLLVLSILFHMVRKILYTN